MNQNFSHFWNNFLNCYFIIFMTYECPHKSSKCETNIENYINWSFLYVVTEFSKMVLTHSIRLE